MTQGSLVNTAADVAADFFSIFGIPTNVLRSLLGHFIEKRINEAFEILIEELRNGQIDDLHAANEDDRVGVIYRYGLAAKEGAARRNLRLLSKAICGLARLDRLYPDEFNKYADILSKLNRDQIFVLGNYVRYYRENIQNGDEFEAARNKAFRTIVDHAVSNHSYNKEHILSIFNQSAALGLLVPYSAWGSLVYNISPILEEITALVGELPDVLSEEQEVQ